jgi:hypothetical protein
MPVGQPGESRVCMCSVCVLCPNRQPVTMKTIRKHAETDVRRGLGDRRKRQRADEKDGDDGPAYGDEDAPAESSGDDEAADIPDPVGTSDDDEQSDMEDLDSVEVFADRMHSLKMAVVDCGATAGVTDAAMNTMLAATYEAFGPYLPPWANHLVPKSVQQCRKGVEDEVCVHTLYAHTLISIRAHTHFYTRIDFCLFAHAHFYTRIDFCLFTHAHFYTRIDFCLFTHPILYAYRCLRP